MKKIRLLILLWILLLAFPTLFAQYTAADYLDWTKKHLDNGNCDDAEETYALYKEKVPQGNVEVEQRIAECRTPAQTTGNNKTDLTFKVGDVTFKMVFVKGGTFQMGSYSGANDEKPLHSVTVSDFYLGEFEVTQALWQEVMGTSVYQQRDKCDARLSFRGVGADYPMCFVSYTEAEVFCGRLNQRLHSQLPVGYSFALPTEAEWEYAARGGDKSKAYTYSGGNCLSDVGWYTDNSGGYKHAVGLKRANELGLYDMSGNVFEWCADWYGNYSSSSQMDPRGPCSGYERVFRSGSWGFNASCSEVTSRGATDPGNRIEFLGFRLAIVRR